MFSQLVLSPGLKPWSQLHSPVPMKVGTLTATAADGFATVNLNAATCESMTVDSGIASKRFQSEQAGARKRDESFRNSLGAGEYPSRGHPQILVVPHLATARFGRAAGVDQVFSNSAAGDGRRRYELQQCDS